jgi:Amt family ammonium transporter
MPQPELLVILSVLALLVRAGQLLYATGLSRSKNAASNATRSLVDVCLATLAFVAVGAAILFQQHNGWFGIRSAFLFASRVSATSSAAIFFNVSAVLIATGAITGALAERSKFICICVASVLLAGLIVPIAGKWAWSGWLHDFGFIDVAGASVIHLSAGVCALLGAVLVGPRNGKYHRDGSASMIPGHNVPLATAGTLVALIGWIAYAAGFSVGRFPVASAALDVLLSAAGGGFASVLLGRFRYGKPDVTLTLIGVFGALVAITGCAGRATAPAAIVVGAVAGVVVPLASVYIDLILRIDDPAGAIAIHAVGGVLGTLAPALVAHGSPASHAKQLGVQLLGVVAVTALAAVLFGVVFALLRATTGLRAKEADEFDGLDLAEHDIGAYPDFQQTMIKSYHLREA